MSVKHCFKMPTRLKITGRSSTITNVFAQAIIPKIEPTEAQIAQALEILGLNADDLRCAYCGDRATEWEHLRPLIKDQRPTGYISEIGNLVPSCGKCNQSKGGRDWKEWMLSDATYSPKTRRIRAIEERILRLDDYAREGGAHKIDFEALVGKEIWDTHWGNWQKVLDAMTTSQKFADQVRQMIAEKHGINGF